MSFSENLERAALFLYRFKLNFYPLKYLSQLAMASLLTGMKGPAPT